jgi:hypothetical protein
MMTSDKPRKSPLYLMPLSGVEIHSDDGFICTFTMLYTTMRAPIESALGTGNNKREILHTFAF